MFFIHAPGRLPTHNRQSTYRPLKMIRAPPSRPSVVPATRISTVTPTIPLPTSTPTSSRANGPVVSKVSAATVPATASSKVANPANTQTMQEKASATSLSQIRGAPNGDDTYASDCFTEVVRSDSAYTSSMSSARSNLTVLHRDLYFGTTSAEPPSDANPSHVSVSTASPANAVIASPSHRVPTPASGNSRELSSASKPAGPAQLEATGVNTKDSALGLEHSSLEQTKKHSRKSRKKATKTVSSEDSVASYLSEIGSVELLDAESEISLARHISKLLKLEQVSSKIRKSTGRDPTTEEWASSAGMDVVTFQRTLRNGLRAKEHMIAANLRLVVSVAKKYLNRGLTFQDLIQEGSVGLIRGAEKFDGDKGFKFSTYATWWIRQAITRAISDHSRPIRLPVHVNDSISAISRSNKILVESLGRTPSEREVAEHMHISVDKLRFLLRCNRATISLEDPISRNQGDSSTSLGSFIVWEGESPEETTMRNLLREDLENVLNTLTPRERDVIRLRYGFEDGKTKTLEEIGARFDVTRERIRQIEVKALRKLRHPSRNAVLREYVYEEN